MFKGAQTSFKETSREPVELSYDVRQLLTAVAILHVVEHGAESNVEKLRLIPRPILKFCSFICFWAILFDLGEQFFNL